MNRSLKDLLSIAIDIKSVYDSYNKAAADGKVTLEEALVLAAGVIATLNKHNVTLAELSEILEAIGPLMFLLKK